MFAKRRAIRVVDELYMRADWLNPRVTRFGDDIAIVMDKSRREHWLVVEHQDKWLVESIRVDDEDNPIPSQLDPKPVTSSRAPARAVAAELLDFIASICRAELLTGLEYPDETEADYGDRQAEALLAYRRLTNPDANHPVVEYLETVFDDQEALYGCYVGVANEERRILAFTDRAIYVCDLELNLYILPIVAAPYCDIDEAEWNGEQLKITWVDDRDVLIFVPHAPTFHVMQKLLEKVDTCGAVPGFAVPVDHINGAVAILLGTVSAEGGELKERVQVTLYSSGINIHVDADEVWQYTWSEIKCYLASGRGVVLQTVNSVVRLSTDRYELWLDALTVHGVSNSIEPGRPGWSMDPLQRHLLRWWNGQRWTGYVHDGECALTDPV